MAYISNEDRRRQLIEAATKVIRTHGVVKATTRRIAEAAGAPLGSLHYCFRSKEELFEEVANNFGIVGKSSFDAAVGEAMGIAAAVESIMDVFSKWRNSTIDDTVSEIEFHLASLRSKRHRSIPKRIYLKWIRFFTELLERAKAEDDAPMDLDGIARLIISHQDGMLLMDKFTTGRSKAEISSSFARMLAAAIRRGEFDRASEASVEGD